MTWPGSGVASCTDTRVTDSCTPGALFAGMGRPLRTMPSTDDNYGETAKVIWLAYLALGLADNRFVTKAQYSEDVS